MTLLDNLKNHYFNFVPEVAQFVDSVYFSLKNEGNLEKLLLLNTNLIYDISIDKENILFNHGIYNIILELNFEMEKEDYLYGSDIIPYRVLEINGNYLGVDSDLTSLYNCTYKVVDIGCSEIPVLDLDIGDVVYECDFSGIKINRLVLNTYNNIIYLYNLGISGVDILSYTISYNLFDNMLLNKLFEYREYIVSKDGKIEIRLMSGKAELYYFVYNMILTHIHENNLSYTVKIDYNIITIV